MISFLQCKVSCRACCESGDPSVATNLDRSADIAIFAPTKQSCFLKLLDSVSVSCIFKHVRMLSYSLRLQQLKRKSPHDPGKSHQSWAMPAPSNDEMPTPTRFSYLASAPMALLHHFCWKCLWTTINGLSTNAFLLKCTIRTTSARPGYGTPMKSTSWLTFSSQGSAGSAHPVLLHSESTSWKMSISQW